MDALIYTTVFVFGLIIGSFLNVVILRWNTGMRISRGRSVCFSCNKTLEWYELIPLFSFLFQMGACRGCKSKISWQYPLVELATAFAFLIAFRSTDVFGGEGIVFALTAAIFCMYIVITVYDMRHKIIPDFFSYGTALLALGLMALKWNAAGGIDFTQVIAGPILFSFFFFFWFVSKGRWMGLGDAKLALSIGWVLGLWQGIAALLFSFWIGAVISILVMLVQRLSGKAGLGMKSEIPFGPYLLLGFIIAYMWHIDVQAILPYLAV